MRNVSDIFVEKDRTYILCSVTSFQKFQRLLDKVWINIAWNTPGRTDQYLDTLYSSGFQTFLFASKITNYIVLVNQI